MSEPSRRPACSPEWLARQPRRAKLEQTLRRTLRTATLAVLAIAPLLAQALPTDLDSWVERTRKEFEVPGIAVAVVKDGKVIHAKGYGVRRLGDSTPVDADTLFGIASNTKAFTAAALAMLVDEGKIAWDDPVIKYLPAFALYDPYVTRELTVRDLLCHRSGLGLGAGDLLFWPDTTFTSDEIVQRLRYIKPATSFRSRYAYDNVLYLVAGQIVPAVTGKSWNDFIRERIFTPLGMSNSNTSIKDFRLNGDIATPHAREEGKQLRPIHYMTADNLAPAGAINSSVNDMAKWIILQLDNGLMRGSVPERRLFSARQSREMWTPQTITPSGDPPPGLEALKSNFSAYGLGWGLNDYRGRKVVSHTGGLAGLVSRVTLVPDLKLGTVVLTNQEAGGAFQAITYHVLDAFLEAPAKDWIAAFHAAAERGLARAAEAEKKLGSTRNADSKLSLPLSKYAGTYSDPWYGEITLAEENGHLVFHAPRAPILTGELEHWQYDTFVVRWRDRTLLADAFVTFALKPDGSIDHFKMQAVSPLTDFSYDFQDLYFTPSVKK